MIASALCIVVGTVLYTLPASRFTLRWEHTVEKVLWEEDYLIAGRWLYLAAARIRGSGAGMEPPADAVRVGDAWHYRPAERWHRAIRLARSSFGADYELCVDGACKGLSVWVPGQPEPTTLTSCADAESTGGPGLR